MDITTFIATYSIVGIGLSLAIELISRKYQSNPVKMKAVTIALSLIVAGVFYYISNTAWFPTFAVILGSASTLYALAFNKKSPN